MLLPERQLPYISEHSFFVDLKRFFVRFILHNIFYLKMCYKIFVLTSVFKRFIIDVLFKI
jgi:hypothetical protein